MVVPPSGDGDAQCSNDQLRHPGFMTLTPQQRDDLHRLLAEELRAAWREATGEGGKPREPADDERQRRRVIRPPDTRTGDAGTSGR
jgi:hypothetical protein